MAPPKVSAYQRYWCLIHGSYMWDVFFAFCPMHDINLDMHSTKLCSKRYCDLHMAVGSTMFVTPPVQILSGHTCMMNMLHIVRTMSLIYVCSMYIRSHPLGIYSIKQSIIPVHNIYRSTDCEGSWKHNICCASCPNFVKPYIHDDCAAYCQNYVLNLCIWHAYLVSSIRHLFNPAIHHPCLQHIPVH